MEKKKKFINPEAELVEFLHEDIITSSDPYGGSGDFDEIGGGEVQ